MPPTISMKQRRVFHWLRTCQRARAAATERDQEERSLQRRRQSFLEQSVCLMLGGTVGRERRYVSRAHGGWQGSTLYGYVERGDDVIFKQKFRATKLTFDYIVSNNICNLQLYRCISR